MKTLPKPLSDETLDKIAKKIFSVVKYGESGVVITWPKSDIDYRLTQFLSDKKLLKKHLGKYYQRYCFIIIRASAETTEEAVTRKLTQQLFSRNVKSFKDKGFIPFCQLAQQKGFEVFFFVLNAELLFTPPPKKLFNLLITVTQDLPRINGLFFFESHLEEKFVDNYLSKKLMQNMFVLPLYELPDTEQFIRYLEAKWKLKVRKKYSTAILNACGGHLWLLKEAVRYLRDHPKVTLDELWKQKGINLKTEAIFKKLSQKARKALVSIYRREPDWEKKDAETAEYLLQINLIKKQKGQFIITIPILNKLIHQSLQSQSLKLKDNKILLVGEDITYLFSPSEKRILTILLLKRGKIVSREKLARFIWQKDWEEKFSDWALDKLIARTRTRLKKFGLSPSIIKTKKRVGFQLEA